MLCGGLSAIFAGSVQVPLNTSKALLKRQALPSYSVHVAQRSASVLY